MMITRRRLALGGLLGVLLLASGCGRKGDLEPPEEQEDEYRYPRQYPAPETVIPTEPPPQSSKRSTAERRSRDRRG